MLLNTSRTGGCRKTAFASRRSIATIPTISRQQLLSVDETLEAARSACEQGATRFCMGAAWRDVPNDSRFDRVLEMVRGVRALGLEACCTLGMLTQDQADACSKPG